MRPRDAMRTFSLAAARPEPPVLAWMRRIAITVISVHLVFASWSAYRRFHQIFRVDLHPSATTLAAGSVVKCDVVTSGEVQNRVRLELVQGSHAETMLELRADVNGISAYDPRLFRYTPRVTVTAALLSRFASGPATLRLTGFGGQKLLQTPPPRVRELPVVISR